ncbi:hypothetical protein FRC07_005282 [Ceratobasidium sp. 392]|nr:hypothetical protein FRC07_005282 [Ceratobasidium sp. 392]
MLRRATVYLATQAPPESEPMPRLPYSYTANDDPLYVSRAPSAAPAAYADKRHVSASSAGSYEHPCQYSHPAQPYLLRATSPVSSRGTLPYEYPLGWQALLR